MNFKKDLSIWSSGSDVYQLQTYLEKLGEGDFIPTGLFGPKTKLAVIKFQKRHGIKPAEGFFGPITRAKMNLILSTPNELLYWVAVGCIGIDASPSDNAPDELGCAETVNEIHLRAFDYYIGGDLSTRRMYLALQFSSQFKETTEFTRGDIVISPTGYGNGNLSNGHVGIVGEAGVIMSNDSDTGKFAPNYTIETWRARYVTKGGFPMKFYRRM